MTSHNLTLCYSNLQHCIATERLLNNVVNCASLLDYIKVYSAERGDLVKRYRRLNLRVSDLLYDRIQRIAIREEITLSQVMRKAIITYVSEYERRNLDL